MVPRRLRATASSVLLVVGALLIGDAVHGVVVLGAYGPASPAAVLRAGGGIAAVLAGHRLRTPVEEYVAMPSESGRGEADADAEFDPELSPLGGEDADRDGGDGESERERERKQEQDRDREQERGRG